MPTEITHANQPQQVPRIPGDPGRLPSRSAFLNGDLWTMFMTGQSYGKKGIDPPTDWPQAGMLLRVPKVVFLSSVPPAHLWGEKFVLMTKWFPFGYFGHWDDSEARDIRFTPPSSRIYGGLVFDGFTGTFKYIGWAIDPHYDQSLDGPRKWKKRATIPNASYSEHLRLVAVYDEVKTILEMRYPGQVFVQVNQFFPSEPLSGFGPNDENVPLILDTFSPDGIAANTPKQWANGPLWMLGPEEVLSFTTDAHGNVTFQCDFFGTNFLHIFAGYQSDDGSIFRGFQERGAPDIGDLKSRFHYERSVEFGNPLDNGVEASFVGYSSWIATANDGYEGDSYEITHDYVTGQLNQYFSVDGPVRNIPQGKLSMLKVAFPNFCGYAAKLFEYDATWEVGSMPTMVQAGSAQPHSHAGISLPVQYPEQDWVEQTIIIDYIDAQAADPNIYGDDFWPGIGFDGGVYNKYVRYPSTPQMALFNAAMQQQYTFMSNALNNLGPKTGEIWDTLIEENELGDYGFEHVGGSSMLTVEYLVNLIETHYGLVP